MNTRSLTLGFRTRELLAKIDARMEQQSLRAGADDPHCVACFGAFESLAGYLEQDLSQHEQGRRLVVINARTVASRLRMLKRVARDHELMVRMSGMRKRWQLK